MNRVIKFRGKRVDNGEWVYGSLSLFQKNKWWHSGCEIWSHDTENGEFNSIDPETVGQFTGLLDKNGKEIYEGDIIHVVYEGGSDFMGDDADYKGIVIYDSEDASFYIQTKHGVDSLGNTEGNKLLVIGNIHDNPELLTA